jgi:hypothetical protein
VISGYRHAAPEAFVSVQERNRLPAASAADHPIEAPRNRVDVATPLQSTVSAKQTAPITAAPKVAPGSALESAPSAAWEADLPAEAQDSSACAAIKTEQFEIAGALNKPYSPEEGRYMQRRLRELAKQSIKRKCAV